jgi:hypothetical protein
VRGGSILQALAPLVHARAVDVGHEVQLTLFTAPGLVALALPSKDADADADADAARVASDTAAQVTDALVLLRPAEPSAKRGAASFRDQVAVLVALSATSTSSTSQLPPLTGYAAAIAKSADGETAAEFGRRRESEPYGRPAVSILEQFSSSAPTASLVPLVPLVPLDSEPDMQSVELIPEQHVPLLIRPRQARGRDAQLLPVGTGDVAGVRLRVGDRVVLRYQTEPAQNGVWFAVPEAQAPAGLVLQSPLALAPARYTAALQAVRTADKRPQVEWKWRFTFDVADTAAGAEGAAGALRVGDAVVWLSLPGSPLGVVVATGGGSDDGSKEVVVAIDAADVSPDPEAARDLAELLHPLANCWQADDVVPTRVQTRRQCTAAGGAWDHPCERDADCPFDQYAVDPADSSHALHRGGCLASGYCEMPLGVARVGYRSFVPPPAASAVGPAFALQSVA